MTRSNEEQDRPRKTQNWLRYSHLGTQFAVTLVVFILLGVKGDQWLATTPWLTVVGSLLGIGGGMYLLIRQVSAIK